MARLMVIDDSAVVRKVIRRALEPYGYSVFGVEDGHSALAALEDTAPDLVLCDGLLPDMNGFEVFHAIRRIPGFQAVPFLLISGQIDAAIEKRVVELGIDGLVGKPFDAPVLVQVIDELLQRSSRQGRRPAARRPALPSCTAALAKLDGPAAFKDRWEILCELPEVLGGLLMNLDGEVLACCGAEQACMAQVASLVPRLVELASDLPVPSGRQPVHSLTVEGAELTFLIQVFASREAVVLVLSSALAVGRAQYRLRELARP